MQEKEEAVSRNQLGLHKHAAAARREGAAAAQLSLTDVAVDVVQVLGHLGEDARPAGQSAAAVAPVAHDAHLHEAAASTTQQGPAVIPLERKSAHAHTHTPEAGPLGPLRNASAFHISPGRRTLRCVNFQKQISHES